MYLIFDTETTGLPKNFNAPITDTDNWPRCIQIAWQLHDEMGRIIEHSDYLIKPNGFDIPYDAEQIHGISTELATQEGVPLNEMIDAFNRVLDKTEFIVGQNVQFDLNIMGCEFFRTETQNPLNELKVLDTCTEDTAQLCAIPGGRGGRFKLPTLTELHQHLFNVRFGEVHNATADVEATARCFFELIRETDIFIPEKLNKKPDYLIQYRRKNPNTTKLIGLKHINLKKASKKYKKDTGNVTTIITKEVQEAFNKANYVHLHNHSRFSLLSSTSTEQDIVNQAYELEMPAVAITDTGNIMGAFNFVDAVAKINKKIQEERATAIENGNSYNRPDFKAIIGAELYVCEDHLDKAKKDNGNLVVFLAKNKNGFTNLSKMSSIAYTKGFYYVPRISKKIVEEYKDDIIVLSGNLSGEIPNLILNVGEKQAEESILWWKNQFKKDFYLELMNHEQENEQIVNQKLLEFSEKHRIKVIATNNTYYLNEKDFDNHDTLLCVRDGQLKSTPIGRGRGFRFGMPNNQYYFKSALEMKALFKNIPQAIINIQEIVDKIEPFKLRRNVLLPAFDIPEKYQDKMDKEDGGKRGENAYLRALTYEGAKKRYPEITKEIKERLDFELKIIAKTGYPGYFLIVQDFCKEARKINVSVGPGRGSAAGSAVAYCIGITNIDPIKYKLLFERFLNPDRVSMPDIDIDFDDEGRQKVIDYVIDKYGANQVAQIITYGSMAAKTSIRDTARVLELPLDEAGRIAKLIPGLSLKKMLSLNDKDLKTKLKNNSDDIAKVHQFRDIAQGTDLSATIIKKAATLEGSLRNTGVHACGVIITPGDITNYVPVSKAKDSEMYVTQFDNGVVEDAGLLKMDFLGLKTLTLIKDALKIIKERHGISLIADDFPLDNQKTYELFQRGETIGVFQYESPGMQKYMRQLEPTKFEDLIAMNALYRPGPMEYIPSFIKRKHGEEEITYDLEDSAEYLEETYGITVYQEQVMLLSQKLAGFTKGQADGLRKAMGKKLKEKLDLLRPLFYEGGQKRGHNPKILEKIWTDWEAFASYAFNKSHSTCYAWIAYQTAYLKANYPSEYMASILSNNMNEIKTITIFMEECKRMGIEVLGPDINESNLDFTVNRKGVIRFGMGAIKGVGASAVESVIAERKENGSFISVYDVMRRIDLRSANKRMLENLILAGGFDSFKKIKREQYFEEVRGGGTFLEFLIKYGHKFKELKDSPQLSLFGDSDEAQLPEPEAPKFEKWSNLQRLSKEKEVVGIYITSHPLDTYKYEFKHFCNATTDDLAKFEQREGQDLFVAGIISEAEHRISAKTDKEFGSFILEDHAGNHKMMLFNNDYLKSRHLLVPGQFIMLKARTETWFKANRKVLKIVDMVPLQEVLEKKTKKIRLAFDINVINQKMVEELHDIIHKYPGEKLLEIVVFEVDKNISIEMPSRFLKVDINKHLLDELKILPCEYYKLN